MDWFKNNTPLVEDYLFPIVSIEGYTGERLYKHIRSRFVRNGKILKEMAKHFEIEDIELTSYVARHTMAMTLQSKEVPRDVISAVMGHSDNKTTQVYLDSVNTDLLVDAAELL